MFSVSFNYFLLIYGQLSTARAQLRSTLDLKWLLYTCYYHIWLKQLVPKYKVSKFIRLINYFAIHFNHDCKNKWNWEIVWSTLTWFIADNQKKSSLNKIMYLILLSVKAERRKCHKQPLTRGTSQTMVKLCFAGKLSIVFKSNESQQNRQAWQTILVSKIWIRRDNWV